MTPADERRLYAHYQLTTGPRGLYAQRIDGRVALVDAPSGLVEPDLDANMQPVRRTTWSIFRDQVANNIDQQCLVL